MLEVKDAEVVRKVVPYAAAGGVAAAEIGLSLELILIGLPWAAGIAAAGGAIYVGNRAIDRAFEKLYAGRGGAPRRAKFVNPPRKGFAESVHDAEFIRKLSAFANEVEWQNGQRVLPKISSTKLAKSVEISASTERDPASRSQGETELRKLVESVSNGRLDARNYVRLLHSGSVSNSELQSAVIEGAKANARQVLRLDLGRERARAERLGISDESGLGDALLALVYFLEKVAKIPNVLESFLAPLSHECQEGSRERGRFDSIFGLQALGDSWRTQEPTAILSQICRALENGEAKYACSVIAGALEHGRLSQEAIIGEPRVQDALRNAILRELRSAATYFSSPGDEGFRPAKAALDSAIQLQSFYAHPDVSQDYTNAWVGLVGALRKREEDPYRNSWRWKDYVYSGLRFPANLPTELVPPIKGDVYDTIGKALTGTVYAERLVPFLRFVDASEYLRDDRRREHFIETIVAELSRYVGAFSRALSDPSERVVRRAERDGTRLRDLLKVMPVMFEPSDELHEFMIAKLREQIAAIASPEHIAEVAQEIGSLVGVRSELLQENKK